MASHSGPSTLSVPPLDIPLHVRYVQNLDKKKDLAYYLTEHLRLNGVYWGLTALCIMGHQDALSREDMIDYVLSCWDEEAGAFGAHIEHDAHIHSTLSAIQILIIQDALDRLSPARTERLVAFLLSCVRPDGRVSGDSFGESDTRFSYILLAALSLLKRMPDLDKLYDGRGRELVVQNIKDSMNFDGAFGREPGAESHGAQVWVCTAGLAIAGALDFVDRDQLGSWLSERQLPHGGLNGRPEKLADVCYSWWELASLSIIHRLHWINGPKLMSFILSSQELEEGGIADRPGDWVDVFHTVFGAAGLSLLGYPRLQDIDPLYCMPAEVTRRLGLGMDHQQIPRLAEWPPALST